MSGFGALFLAGWEFGMGLWLVFKGFKPDALARLASTGSDVAA